MTEVYRISQTEILLFAMVLLRVTSFVVTWPIFGAELINQHIKVLFGFILALVLYPTLKWQAPQISAVESNTVLLALREVFVGLSIGLLARFFFFSFRIAGEMISQAMGLSSAQLFNPAVGGQTTAVESFYVALASLFFLAFNGHHFLLIGLWKTFEFFPAATLSLRTESFVDIGQIVQTTVDLGLRFSAPIVVSILVVNLVLGVVGKTVPQLNVLITSFPINILAGLTLMAVTLPMLLDQMTTFLELSTDRVFSFVKAF